MFNIQCLMVHIFFMIGVTTPVACSYRQVEKNFFKAVFSTPFDEAGARQALSDGVDVNIHLNDKPVIIYALQGRPGGGLLTTPDPRMLLFLVQHGAYINGETSAAVIPEVTPLTIIATRAGFYPENIQRYIQEAILFIEYGAKIDKQVASGKTPLAVFCSSMALKGAHFLERNNVTMHDQIVKDLSHFMRLLSTCNADFDIPDNSGDTPCAIIARWPHYVQKLFRQ